jgi:hypothetical protein
LLRFIQSSEIVVTERGDNILAVVEQFIEHAVMAPHVEKHDNVLVGTAALAMDIARRAGLIDASGTNLLERAVGFIKTMLALHNKCVIVDQMPVENDLFVRVEFEQHMDDMVLLVDIQYGILLLSG